MSDFSKEFGIIPQNLKSQQQIYDWLTQYEYENPSISPIRFSFTGLNKNPNYHLFFPSLDIPDEWLKPLGDSATKTSDGVFLRLDPGVWENFVFYATRWFSKTNKILSIDDLPAVDETPPESRQTTQSNKIKDIIQSYNISGEQTNKSNRIILSASIDTYGVEDYLKIVLSDHDWFFVSSENEKTSMVKEIRSLIKTPWAEIQFNYSENSILIPLPNKNKKKMDVTNLQIIKNILSIFKKYKYSTKPLDDFAFTGGMTGSASPLSQEEITQLRKKKKEKEIKEEKTTITEDKREIRKQIERANYSEQENATLEFIKTFLPELEGEKQGNLQGFYPEIKNHLYAMYQRAYNPQYNAFLQENPEIANNIIDKSLEALTFGVTRNKSIIADQPGAGKTLTAVLISETQAKIADKKTGAKSQILVLSPGQLIGQNWLSKNSEALKYVYPGEDVKNIVQVIRKHNEEFSRNVRWIIIPYSLLQLTGKEKQKQQLRINISNLIRRIRQHGFASVVLDESQYAKTIDLEQIGGASTNIKKLTSKSITTRANNTYLAINGIPKRVCLTGTPADNTPADLYGQLLMVDHPCLYIKGTLMSRTDFANIYFAGYGVRSFDTRKFEGNIHKVDNCRALLDMFDGVFLRRERADINEKLFTLQETNPPIEKEVYSNVVDENGKNIVFDDLFWQQIDENVLDTIAQLRAQKRAKNIENVNLEQSTQIEKANLITELQLGEQVSQMAFEKQLSKKIALAKAPTSAKLAVEHLKGSAVIEGKIIPNKSFILTSYPDVAQAILDLVKKFSGNNNIADIIHGGVDFKERQPIVQRFQNENDPLKVLIFTVQTGAVGYNFEKVNFCIFNDFSWNPSVNEQASDRIRRLTSKLKPTIQYVVIPTPGETTDTMAPGHSNIDKRMYFIMREKRNINAMVHNTLKKVNTIRHGGDFSPEEQEKQLNILSQRFAGSILNTLEQDKEIRELYTPRYKKFKQKVAFIPISARKIIAEILSLK